MSSPRRIRTIYAKELVAILRDRRTLIAMIVVPIVLYPILMLGSIQAVSYQAESMGRSELVVGVVNEDQRLSLESLIRRDTAALAQRQATFDPEPRDSSRAPNVETPPAPLEKVRTVPLGSRAEIERRVRDRSIHVGLVFGSDTLVREPDAQNTVELLFDKEDMRSVSARNRLAELIQRTAERTVGERKERAGLPATFDQPFQVITTDLSAPPSILGQVLPLILILMTITGAIYPAIDLTAGERERGTLESLMVCPVPVIDLIVGKFLVVTTVAIMGAALNLASVSATVYFGGFDKVIASTGGGLPIGKMVFILLCLIPFAVLMSAIMIAVCSFARTFKEAQNYVTPVILAVLIPGGIAAFPATRFEGIMLVMPVGNMVLLARETLLGAVVAPWQVAMVLISTSLYAGAAVAVAANVFGRESVVFADAGSLKSAFSRRTFKPAVKPSVSMGLLVVALLFPTWFFVQAMFSPGPGEDASGLLHATGTLMPLLFVLLPAVILLYWKVDVGHSFAFRMPAVRHLTAGLLLGASAWIPAHELIVFQQSIIGVPEAVVENVEALATAMSALPPGSVFVLIALVPALCEELLFRGFLLSSLSTTGRKWTAILVSAMIFGVFHFLLFKFIVTASLGVLLAYLCWQTRSIWPAVLAHFLHNAIGVLSIVRPEWYTLLGIGASTESAHLPVHVLIVGAIVFAIGLLMTSSAVEPKIEQPVPVIANG